MLLHIIEIFFHLTEKLAEAIRKLASLKADLEQSIDRRNEQHRLRSADERQSTKKKVTGC